jgi:hypothetical protein
MASQNYLKKLRLEKEKLIKLKKEEADVRREKLELAKLRKDIKKLKESPREKQLKAYGKKTLKQTGKGLGNFFAGAYKYGEIATRPDKTPVKPVRRTVRKKVV